MNSAKASGSEGAPSPKGPKPRECGCKGIRTCKICELGKDQTFFVKDQEPQVVLEFCLSSDRLCVASNHQSQGTNDNTPSIKDPEGIERQSNWDPVSDILGEDDFGGITILEDFVNEEEEMNLEREIAATPFAISQSGRRKQDFGPKVNFKRQKVKTASFSGLPDYSQALYDRMKLHPCLRGFEPVELCNLEYCASRGAHIDPHKDDAWLWGERLVTLNLLSNSILTFTKDSRPGLHIQVPLKRRSLLVVSGKARHEWKHGVRSQDVGERRIAMTFRELSDEFKKGGLREKDGSELLDLALTFEGIAIGS